MRTCSLLLASHSRKIVAESSQNAKKILLFLLCHHSLSIRFLLLALGANTAFGFDVFVPIFFAVVVGDLFAEHDILLRLDPNMPLQNLRFGIRATGMIEIPCSVPSW